MTTDARIARRKLSLLELAQDLGNVSKACKLVGYSRQQFYEIVSVRLGAALRGRGDLGGLPLRLEHFLLTRARSRSWRGSCGIRRG
jgi:hypothetical protein